MLSDCYRGILYVSNLQKVTTDFSLYTISLIISTVVHRNSNNKAVSRENCALEILYGLKDKHRGIFKERTKNYIINLESFT